MQIITGREKWTYAIGNIPFSVKDAAYANFVVFYYTQVHGLSGTLAGLAMFIALTWDAVTDPVVGSWSDSLRSRWGRRHPLLVAANASSPLLASPAIDTSGSAMNSMRKPARTISWSSTNNSRIVDCSVICSLLTAPR